MHVKIVFFPSRLLISSLFHISLYYSWYIHVLYAASRTSIRRLSVFEPCGFYRPLILVYEFRFCIITAQFLLVHFTYDSTRLFLLYAHTYILRHSFSRERCWDYLFSWEYFCSQSRAVCCRPVDVCVKYFSGTVEVLSLLRVSVKCSSSLIDWSYMLFVQDTDHCHVAVGH